MIQSPGSTPNEPCVVDSPSSHRIKMQYAETKKAAQGGFSFTPQHPKCCETCNWCGRRDSNSHTLRRWNLNPVCLPIPPHPHLKRLKQRRQIMNLAPFRIWGGRRGSNPRQRESQSRALPTELRPPYCVVTDAFKLNATCAKAA